MASEGYKRFKARLSDNEIVFKTIAATALSVMAVVVSIAQFVTARQQLELSTLQARIARANALPNFDLSITQKPDPAGYFGEWELVLSNSGGPVHEVTAEAMHVLHAEAPPTKGIGPTVKTDIPINGFYSVQSISPASKGELARFAGKDNERILTAVENDTRSAAKSKGWAFLVFDERSFVHLRYRDLLGDAHEEYFQVDPIRGSRRLSDSESGALRKLWTSPMDELTRLNPAILLDKISRNAH